MQVMPATGKDLKVGDITETEANIHAGVKYMRWMIDQYYEKEPMTKLDKALFAFASYNAGPGRIASLRKEAANAAARPPTSGSTTWSMSPPRRSRSGDGDLRLEHLQVLHRLSPTHRIESGAGAGRREAQAGRQVNVSRPQPVIEGVSVSGRHANRSS